MVPIGHQLAGDEGQHLHLGPVLGQVEGIDGSRDRCARFRLRVSLAAGVAVRLHGVIQVLERRGQGAGHRQVAQHVAAPQQVEGGSAGPALAVAQRHRRRDGGVRLGRGVVGGDGRRDDGVRLGAGVVGREGRRDGGVPLGRRFEGHQRTGDGLGHLGRGAIVGELGVRVALGLVDGRHDGGGDFGPHEVICQGRGDGVVGLLRGVRIAAEAEGPVVVGELDAQGARGVEVADLVGPGQQVPGHVPQPGGGVDQVGGAAQRGDLRQDAVDGGLQGVQVAEVSCRGEGPGALESEDLRVVPVEAGVLQGLSGLVGRLGQVGQKRRGNPLVHVGRRLPGGQVDGQLVHHGLQRISCCYAGQSGVVGGSDATVHRCSGRVIGQLQVHGGRRALSVDFALEGVQGGLVGLGRQALSQAGVDSHEAGSIGQDGSLCCGEVCSQSVRG